MKSTCALRLAEQRYVNYDPSLDQDSFPITLHLIKDILEKTLASLAFTGISRFFFKITPQDFTILYPPSKRISVGRANAFDEANVLAMASIPVASFSASKIHDHLKSKHGFDEAPNGETYSKMFRQNVFGIDKAIQNYNSKLMNSIWGQYNLYAAHAFQKNNESSAKIADIFSVPQVKNLWDIRAAH